MYRLKYLIVAILMAFILEFQTACGPEGNEQHSDSTKVTPAPQTSQTQASNFDENTDYFLPTELIYSQQADKVLKDKFYPIGWSGDGKFAYIVEEVDEGCGCYFFKIAIQDLHTDKLVWNWKFNDQGKSEDIKTVWSKNYDDFKKQLKQYKIVQQTKFSLGGVRFAYQNEDFTLSMETKTKQDKDFGLDVVTETYIRIQSAKQGTKTIYQYIEQGASVVLSASVAGYLQSPYENRIVVIHFDERRGYEGPPNVITIKLAGCQLSGNFKN